MHFLRDRSNDLDVVTNISDAEFIERSHQRGEHDEADKQEWKNSINKTMLTVSPDKIINTTGYISDLLDGTNTSKVVDENGEPRVVYHHTDSEPFTVFDLSRTGQNWSQSWDYGREAAFFLSYEQKEMKDWGDRAIPVFLNIRNPEESNISSIGRKKYFTPSKDADGLVPLVGYDGWQDELHTLTRKYENYPDRNARKEIFKKSLTYLGQGFDNWGQEYVVFSPNQIKSATDNIGTFSNRNNSINYHIDYWQRRRRHEKMLKSRLSQTNSLPLARKIVGEFNKKYGTNFGLAPDLKITLRLPKVDGTDTILSEPALNSSREQMNGIAAFLQQLLPGVRVVTYSPEKFNQIKAENRFHPDAQAFIYKGVIVTSNTLRDADVMIEEFLHPFIETLLIKQPDLYYRLLEEAKVAFPSLYQQIQESYHGSSEMVQDKEIITQALSRYFREDLGKDKKHHNKFEEVARKFIEFFKSLFGLDMDFTKNKYGNQVIPVDRLINVQSLNDLATILNTSGISFDVTEGIEATGNRPTYHLENLGESDAEFSHVDEAVSTGNWTDEALDQLDNLINEYNDGRNEITQILGRSLSERSRGAEAYAAASIIAERVQSSVQKSNGTFSAVEEFRAKNKERKLKENAVQQWAQENGWWWNDFAEGQFLDDYLVNEYDEAIAEGSESIVHLNKDGRYVIKAMSAIASDGDIVPLLQKIELHNQIFTNTSLEILGFGRTKDGNFRVIVQQSFVQGEKIPAEEAEQVLVNVLGATNNT